MNSSSRPEICLIEPAIQTDINGILAESLFKKRIILIMNLVRILFVRTHYVLAKMLKSIGNPNPYYAATLLIAIFIALDTMAVFVVVATIIGSSGELLGANTYYVISAVYFAFYLYLVRYVFGSKAYSLNMMRGMYKADKVNRYKIYVSLWAMFSVISLPLLGWALSISVLGLALCPSILALLVV